MSSDGGRARSGGTAVAAVGAVDRGPPAVVVGVVALAITKAGDVATTVVGLGLDGGLRERNPIAAAVVAEYGAVPGLVAAAAVSVLVVAAVVEGGFRLSARTDDWGAESARNGRLACYGVGCLCNLGITAYNAVLVVGVAAGG